MKQKHLLLRISFVMILLIAAFHTFFILIGGPTLPKTPDFLTMQELMSSIQVDSGAGIMRTTQNFMDGFNILISIFLFGLPILGLLVLPEIKDKPKAINKLALAILISFLAFFFTSLTLLAIGGTVLSGIVCILLASSLIKKSI